MSFLPCTVAFTTFGNFGFAVGLIFTRKEPRALAPAGKPCCSGLTVGKLAESVVPAMTTLPAPSSAIRLGVSVPLPPKRDEKSSVAPFGLKRAMKVFMLAGGDDCSGAPAAGKSRDIAHPAT